MAENREHERRFLVTDAGILKGSVGNEIVQGYLFSLNGWKGRARRSRIADDKRNYVDSTAVFTLKGPKQGATSAEYEFELELAHALDLIDIAPFKVEKTRHQVISEGSAWDVDVFHGLNEGLVIAECEGSREQVALLRAPWWCGVEVTQDGRYNNENLASDPWGKWGRK